MHVNVRYKYPEYPGNPRATELSRRIGALKTQKNLDGSGVLYIIFGAFSFILGIFYDPRLLLPGLVLPVAGVHQFRVHQNRKAEIEWLEYELQKALDDHHSRY